MSILTYTRRSVAAGHCGIANTVYLDVYKEEEHLTQITTRNVLMGDFMWRGIKYAFFPKRTPFVGRKYSITGNGQNVGGMKLGRNAFTSIITTLKLAPTIHTGWCR